MMASFFAPLVGNSLNVYEEEMKVFSQAPWKPSCSCFTSIVAKTVLRNRERWHVMPL